MIGAIAGDIVGSLYERQPIKTKSFPLIQPGCRFTDDTILTVAVASAILGDLDYRKEVWGFGNLYPNAGYGKSFQKWLRLPGAGPYNSWGNGSAMRVSPVGFACDSVERVLEEAARSAEITHNHPEGIKGAQATALAVFLARTTHDRKLIRTEVARRFGYDLDRTVDSIRPGYRFDISCRGSVPESIISFLDSDSWEDAVRNAVSLGGDSDTMACIAGGLAEAFYGPVAPEVLEKIRRKLSYELWEVTERFYRKLGMEMSSGGTPRPGESGKLPGPSITVRRLEKQDWPDTWRIMEPVFRAGETYAYSPDISEKEAQREWVEKPSATYVAEHSGKIVGTYYIKPNQPALGPHVCNCGYIVGESARGRGVASLMCEHSQREAVAMGFRAMQYNLVIASNEGAVRLWRKHGFTITRTLADAFRHPRLGFVDAHIMYKELEA